MLPTRNNIKKIEEWLDSDDEFPDIVHESPEPPAYLNDDRFETIKFGWIYNKNITQCSEIVEVETQNSPSTEECKTENIFVPNQVTTFRFRKGLLKKYDIFCLQSIENYTSDSTLLWFANFLMYKDMLTRNKFLKSCLVIENVCNGLYKHEKTEKKKKDNNDQEHNYRIVIKKKNISNVLGLL